MQFTNLVHGTLQKRYKRFLADVVLDDGSVVIAHCTNSGSMKSCIEEGAEVYLSVSDNPKRKTKYTWEMIKINGAWVGIHTTLPNMLVYEAIVNNEIPQLRNYTTIKREAKYESSRFDILASNNEEICYIEIKNVTMKVDNYARFPDAVTERGRKHLNLLMQVKEQGMRAVMIYVIQRMDVDTFGTAYTIDPMYANTLQMAYAKGVEIIPLQAELTPQGVRIVKELPFNLKID